MEKQIKSEHSVWRKITPFACDTNKAIGQCFLIWIAITLVILYLIFRKK